jgi:hypothetical protein
MIYIWDHDIARQRQQELLAAAERSRRARIARDHNAQARTGYCKTAYAALLARVQRMLSLVGNERLAPIAADVRRRFAVVLARGNGANGGP